MNSMQLIQQATTRWLKLPDQSAMPPALMQDLLISLNAAQAQVWRELPAHYKRRPLSFGFYGPSTGTIDITGYARRTVTDPLFSSVLDTSEYVLHEITYEGALLTYLGETVTFNELTVTQSPRPYCSIVIAGDTATNTLDNDVLRHPYLGTGSGVTAATLYHDAILADVMVERIISPMVDRITGQPYYHVPAHAYQPGACSRREYTLRRITHEGVARTLVELPPLHRDVAVLSADAMIAPTAITLGGSQRPVTLPYDDEVAGLIVATAGVSLLAHPLFDTSRLSSSDASNAAGFAANHLRSFAPSSTNQTNAVGTPPGW